MHRRGALVGFASLALIAGSMCAGCSRGDQTLYVASDRSETLTVTINGTRKEQTMRAFQAYPDVKLTKGAEIVIEAGGVEIEHATLPAIEEGNAALFLVQGAPTLHLVDYKNLAVVSDRSGRGGASGGLGFGPISTNDARIVPVDRVKKTVGFDRRAVVAGPDDPFPKGGQVNQLTFEKFPIFRLERVPAGTVDPFQVIGPRVTKELGRDVLPGQPGYQPR